MAEGQDHDGSSVCWKQGDEVASLFITMSASLSLGAFGDWSAGLSSIFRCPASMACFPGTGGVASRATCFVSVTARGWLGGWTGVWGISGTGDSICRFHWFSHLEGQELTTLAPKYVDRYMVLDGECWFWIHRIRVLPREKGEVRQASSIRYDAGLCPLLSRNARGAGGTDPGISPLSGPPGTGAWEIQGSHAAAGRDSAVEDFWYTPS